MTGPVIPARRARATAARDAQGQLVATAWLWAIALVLILAPSALAALGAFDPSTEVIVPQVQYSAGSDTHPFVAVTAAIGGIAFAFGCVTLFLRGDAVPSGRGIAVIAMFGVATVVLLIFVVMRVLSPTWSGSLGLAALMAGTTMYFPAWFALLSLRRGSGLGLGIRSFLACIPTLVGFVLGFAVFIGWG